MAATDPAFLTPPPRHLAELRIDTAPSAVAFSAPCGSAGAGLKRRCLVPASSVRKRMLLELDPFDVAPAPSSTPPSRTPSPSPPPSPMASRAGAPFSFGITRSVVPPSSPGENIFEFVPSFLAAPERPKTPTATGPTASGGFMFAAPPEGSLTPTSDGLSSLASPKQPLTPPFTASRSPPPLLNPGNGSLFLRRAATSARRKSLRQLEEQQQLTPPPQRIAKTNSLAAGEASRSCNMSGSSASPCCTFFTSPSKEAAKQEAKKAFSEASRSPSGSHCSSQARPAPPEKENKQEREVGVSSSPRERAPTSPAVVCSGAEVVVRVTCKCGVHKEFCFDHHL